VVARSEPPAPDRLAQDPDVEAVTNQIAVPLSGRARGFTSLRPLHHRNFALLWAGGLISIVGSWMQTVAVGALVIAHTGQATWAVVVAAGAFLPIGLLSPVGGALADRLPRRAALVVGNLVAGAVALVIAALVAAGRDGPGLLTLLVTVQGCVSAVIGPFQQAILPDLVPRSEFLAAASLNSAQFNLGRVGGSAGRCWPARPWPPSATRSPSSPTRCRSSSSSWPSPSCSSARHPDGTIASGFSSRCASVYEGRAPSPVAAPRSG
jgi:hypothetical protein